MKPNAYIGESWGDIPELLREVRAEAGLTHEALAEALECTPPAVRHYLTGRRDPGFDRARELLFACGYRLTFVIEPVRDGVGK